MPRDLHPLDAWLTANGKTRMWLVKRLDSTEASISRIISGHQWPSKPLVREIMRITGGKVTANDFAHEPQRGAA